MESWAVLRTNRVAFIMNAVICGTLTAGYIGDLLKGRKTLGFFVAFLAFIVVYQTVCVIAFKRDKAALRFKYYILIGYAFVYCFAIFSSATYFTYVFAFPIIVLYVLYHDNKLMINIAAITVILNIAKVAYQISRGHTESDDITSYTVQMACVILVGIGLYIDTKITMAINNEKIEKLREYSRMFEDNSRDLLYHSINEQLVKTQDIVSFTSHIKELSGEMIEISKSSSSVLDYELQNLSRLQDETAKLNELSMSVYNSVEQLNDLASNISETVKNISDIAFTTNILAINASIEAARTGGDRSGNQGFNAVADEVKRLAAQSGESANTITSVTEDLIAKISHTLSEVKYLNEYNASQNKAISDVESTCGDVAEKIGQLSAKVLNLDGELSNLSSANRDIMDSTQKLTGIAAMSQTMELE